MEFDAYLHYLRFLDKCLEIRRLKSMIDFLDNMTKSKLNGLVYPSFDMQLLGYEYKLKRMIDES